MPTAGSAGSTQAARREPALSAVAAADAALGVKPAYAAPRAVAPSHARSAGALMPLHRPRAFVIRSLLFFGFWLLLLEPKSLALAAIGVDWAVGALAALAAAALSLRLLPAAPRGPRPWLLLRYLLRFLGQSLAAGLDVARRALDPRLPVGPVLLRQPTALPPGTARALFGAVTSQVPGTLCIGAGDADELLYHCLDNGPDAARALARDEALLRDVLGAGGPRAAEPRS
jgi:multicomponent Na+:H+ antiporter subunit E